MKISLKTLTAGFAFIILCTSALAQQDFPDTPDTAVSSTIRAVIAATHHPRMKMAEISRCDDKTFGIDEFLIVTLKNDTLCLN